jgi:FkbM family methyltransferase
MNLKDRIVNKLWRSIPTPKARIHLLNISFKVPRFIYVNFYHSNYQTEGWLIHLIKKINNWRKIETFIDVGVNIGQTLLKVKAIDKNIPYIGFEPNPFCTGLTEKIISLNNLDNCTIIPAGLSNENQILKLVFHNKDNLLDSSASVIENFRENEAGNKEIFVPVYALDKIINGLNTNKIDLIKIDIEGGELEALEGMNETIQKHKPIIILEVLPAYSEKNIFRIKRQQAILQLFRMWEYKLYQIQKHHSNFSLKEVKQFPINNDLATSDYLSVPSYINIKEL